MRFPRLRQLLLEHAVLLTVLWSMNNFSSSPLDVNSRWNSASRVAAFLSCFCSSFSSRSFSESRCVSSACKRAASTWSRAASMRACFASSRALSDLREAASSFSGDRRGASATCWRRFGEFGALPRGDHGGLGG